MVSRYKEQRSIAHMGTNPLRKKDIPAVFRQHPYRDKLSWNVVRKVGNTVYKNRSQNML